MKARYNTSKIMRNAWYMKKNFMKDQGFATCLRKAWRNEKMRVMQRIGEGLPIDEPKVSTCQPENSPAFIAGCLAYYQNARPGQYFGD